MSDTQTSEHAEAARNADAGHAFVTDVAQIRRRARRRIQNGAAAADAAADRETVLQLLNDALATELVCGLRYKRHYHMAGGAATEVLRDELLQHANEEQGHADQLAQRILELGGSPNFEPAGSVDRSRSEYLEDETLSDMLAEDLIAERIAIESYREIIQYLDDKDTATRGLFESILAVEIEHAEELRSMREDLLRRERPVTVGAGDRQLEQ